MPRTEAPPRRFYVIAREVEPSLELLGYDPDQAVSVQIGGSLQAFANLLRREGEAVEELLKPAEWHAIAEILSGNLDIQLYARSSLPTATVILANLEDSGGPKPLIAKIKGFSETRCEAIAAAVRWLRSQETPPGDWWKVRHRMPAKAGRK